MNKFTAIENIAAFLQETKGSVLASWSGKMSAKQQREMFGVFMGKGEIEINGTKETVSHTIKVGFGMDYETTWGATFGTIDQDSDARFDAYFVADNF